MNNSEIAAEIKSTEEKLANLRTKLEAANSVKFVQCRIFGGKIAAINSGSVPLERMVDNIGVEKSSFGGFWVYLPENLAIIGAQPSLARY